ncbi:MAG: response regulator [Chloroflexi bacterium]|nr:response regulator [Chloroflexota bacterium]
MTSRAKPLVLIIDDSLMMRMIIKDELERHELQAEVANSGEEGLVKMVSLRPDLVCCDVVMPGIDGYEVCRRLRANPSTRSIPIILVTGQSSIEEKLRGFDVGADDYIIKPFDPPELAVRVLTLLARSSAVRDQVAVRQLQQGQVITVFSLKGGVGTTTIAVNLAASLARQSGQQVALADLSLDKGCVAFYLDLTPRGTIEEFAREVAELPPGTDPELSLYLTSHASGVNCLAAPRTPQAAELIRPEASEAAILALRQHFPTTILDTSASFTGHTLTALDKADEVLLVLTPDLPGIKLARDALQVFRSLGSPFSRSRLVVNQIQDRKSVPPEQIARILRLPVAATIPYGGDRLQNAVAEGKPLVVVQPDHPFSQAIGRLVKVRK